MSTPPQGVKTPSEGVTSHKEGVKTPSEGVMCHKEQLSNWKFVTIAAYLRYNPFVKYVQTMK